MHLGAVDPDRALDPGLLRVVQAEDGHAGHGLAGAGLADDAEGLAQLDGVGQVVDGGDEAVGGGEPDREVLDDEDTGSRSLGIWVTSVSLGGRGRCRGRRR